MLILPIKRKWFNMILQGEKKEEYREIKPYWTSRFYPSGETVKPKYVNVMFRNGYSRNSPSVRARCLVHVGKGREEWGAAPGKEYYVLSIIKKE